MTPEIGSRWTDRWGDVYTVHAVSGKFVLVADATSQPDVVIHIDEFGTNLRPAQLPGQTTMFPDDAA